MSQKAFAPGLECLGVVQLQNLHVGDDQACPLDRAEDFRQGRNVAAGEDVLGDPGIGYPGWTVPTDCVQERDAVFGKKLRTLVEEDVVKADPAMFEHADRNNSIEPAA